MVVGNFYGLILEKHQGFLKIHNIGQIVSKVTVLIKDIDSAARIRSF